MYYFPSLARAALTLELCALLFLVRTISAQNLTDLRALRTTGASSDMFTGSVRDAIDISGFDPYVPVPNGTDLLTCMRLLGERGLRRICIVDDNERVTGVLSQSSLLQWLHENKAHLGHDLRKTCAMLGFVVGRELVVCIKESALAAEAFKMMVDNGTTSVGVVEDDTDALITVLSVRDLKALRRIEDGVPTFDFAYLFETVMDYVAHSRQMSLDTKAPVVYVHADTLLEDILDKLCATRMHRLFIADAHKIPIGVVTLGDVIRSIPTRP